MPNTAPEAAPLDVALGVIEDGAGRVLVGQRGAGQHQPGRLEFPGGKLEADESPVAGLVREIGEETGLGVEQAIPCLRLEHDYGDRRVRLHVFRVPHWSGEVRECEGRALCWREATALDPADFPAANGPILRLLQLPDFLLVTPDPAGSDGIAAVVDRVAARLRHGDVGLLQVRAPGLARDDYLRFARDLVAVAQSLGTEVLLNAPLDWLDELPPAGVHLPERRWRALSRRPAVAGRISVSAHDVTGLREAGRLAPDLAVVGPVRPTRTHPGATPLGWDGLALLTAASPVPVYALGGLDAGSLAPARAAGACGIAAIRGLLGDPPGGGE
ncbi:Nudix family hydrolase [Thioalkalivibrio sp. ALE11]|uniref:Nudix family hydrolase n=1 Tax=Thioalkalivibrio sp. ALE11 TaxID=1265494 RepID=UPI000475B8BA|nr:Nudix family hydrolase [Thioalkalivibrio sp. ALE11]